MISFANKLQLDVVLLLVFGLCVLLEKKVVKKCSFVDQYKKMWVRFGCEYVCMKKSLGIYRIIYAQIGANSTV